MSDMSNKDRDCIVAAILTHAQMSKSERTTEMADVLRTYTDTMQAIIEADIGAIWYAYAQYRDSHRKGTLS